MKDKRHKAPAGASAGANSSGVPGRTTRTMRLVAAPSVAAFPRVPVGRDSGSSVSLSNVTGDAAKVSKVKEEAATHPGEFKILGGLPDVGPWATGPVTVGLRPQSEGPRQTTFLLLDAHGAQLGQLPATGIGMSGTTEADATVTPPTDAASCTDGPDFDPAAEYDAGLSTEMPEGCSIDSPMIAADAVTGVHFYVQFDKAVMREADQVPSMWQFGPAAAGPYTFHPHTRQGQLLFYIAYHQERRQNEWVIGPDRVWEFADSVDLYAGAAAAALPGSRNVADSTRDGADGSKRIPSLLEQEAMGDAPWQQPDALAKTEASDSDDVAQAAKTAEETFIHNKGGAAALAARDARIRITDYVEPAKRMAKEVAALVADGEVDHLVGREMARTSRNALLSRTRERLSPAGQTFSKAVKSDEGRSAEYMTARKVRESVDGWRGFDKQGNPLEPEVVEKIRGDLAADSELWAKYAAAVDAAEGADDAYRQAIRDLGESPTVSRAIIESSGNTGKLVTALARVGPYVQGGIAALSALDMAYRIVSAEEGQRWHIAAQEMQAFTAGAVGAQLGSMGAVFVASLVTGTDGVLLVVSVLGGMVGGALGVQYSDPVMRMFAGAVADKYVDLNPVTVGIAGGGFGGMADRDQRTHMKPTAIADDVEAAIFSMDEALVVVDHKIAAAPNRDILESLQAARLDLVQRRGRAEAALAALRSGSGDQVGATPADSPHGDGAE